MQTQEPNDGYKRLRSSYLSSIVSISLVLFMLGLLGLLVLDARKISDYLREHVTLTVYLEDSLSREDLTALQKKISAGNYVKSVRLISKEEALDSLKRQLGEGAVSMIESNPLPATIDLTLRAAYAQPDSIHRIQAILSKEAGVHEISYQETEVEKMNKNFRTIALIILIFNGLLFFIAVALINNTIRLSLHSRRFLIKSMQLVGATRSFIRWPFLKKGFIHGMYSGIISIILLAGIVYLVQRNFPEFGQLSDLQNLAFLFGGVIVFGIVLSGISTFIAVNRYLRIRAGNLY